MLFAKKVYILESVIACMDICGILLAFVRTREVAVSSRNVVSRTFPHFSQSILTPMPTPIQSFLETHHFFGNPSLIYTILRLMYNITHNTIKSHRSSMDRLLHSTRSWMHYRPTSGRVGSRLSCLYLSSARYAVGRHPTDDIRGSRRVQDKTDLDGTLKS